MRLKKLGRTRWASDEEAAHYTQYLNTEVDVIGKIRLSIRPKAHLAPRPHIPDGRGEHGQEARLLDDDNMEIQEWVHWAALPRVCLLHATTPRPLLQSTRKRGVVWKLLQRHRLCLDALGWPAPTSRCGSARCALMPSADRSR